MLCQRGWALFSVITASAKNVLWNARRMASSYVRCIPGEDRMQITVEYGREGGATRAYNLDRRQTEELGISLTRLKTSLAKRLSKKKKKKKNVPIDINVEQAGKNEEDDGLHVMIVSGAGCQVEETVPNCSAWAQGNHLRIGNTDIPISVNPPTVKLMPFPSSVMAGFPIFPRFELEFADLSQCMFTWEVVNSSPQEEVLGAEGGEKTSDGSTSALDKCFDQIYTPTTSDIGLRLKLTCVPMKNGVSGKEDSVISEEVKPGPGICPFDTRHLFTGARTDENEFRVVSYNLLADIYSDSDFARDSLFPYCPPYALDMDYRRQLILKEIAGYNADIVCLQEVDRKIFEHELVPSLDLLGYTGSLKLKGEKGSEGVATFVFRDKFRIVDQSDVTLTETLLNDEHCADLASAVRQVPALVTKLGDRSTVLQTCILQSCSHPARYLCLANTHLYFHPSAGHVRLLQGAASLRHIQRVCQPYQQQGKSVAVVFCGDFNSTPQRGIVQLFTKKHVPEDYLDWSDGGPEERVNGLELRHDLDLASACGDESYTNFTAGFQAMLDYIFISTRQLSVKQVVPPPSEHELTLHTAIPSVVVPSDHIAQVCDLAWTA